MMSRYVTTLAIIVFALLVCNTDDGWAQTGIRSNDGRDNLMDIVGRCGCDACGGSLEHNNPVEEGKEGDGTNNFFIVTRWTATATNGGGLIQGDPTTLTWSIIPDGTDANGGPGNVPSNMIAVWDNLFNEANAGNPDLTTRFWWSLIQQSLDRWGEVSGVEYVYEPNDDGLPNFGAGGSLGFRGDVRIGGFNIDGPNGILAFNEFPNGGDMAVDTSDTGNFGFAFANFRVFRNVYTHEQGHGLGIAHLESNNADFLMEPFISTSFDGPQLDDIRAVHRHYGDVNEKSNNLAGNNSITNATVLGTIADGGSVTIGTDGATGTVVNINDDDFVSIDDNSDTDFYRITVNDVAFLDVTLTPVGGTYNQSQEGGCGCNAVNATSQSNLTLALFTPTGSLIAFENSTGLGQPEQILNQIVAPGDVLVRVQGNANTIQLYTLQVTADYLDIPNSTPPTLLSVDPGTIAEGDVSDLAASDDQRVKILAAGDDPPIRALMTFFTPDPLPVDLSVDYEGFGNSANLQQTMSIFNNDTSLFEEVDSRAVALTDTMFNVNPSGNPQRFVQFPSGLTLIEMVYEPVGPVIQFPWAIFIDEVILITVD